MLLGHLPGTEFPHEFLPQPGDRFWTPADWAWAGGLLNVLLPGLHYGVPVVAHVRPKSASSELAQGWPRKAVVELADPAALGEAMRGSTTVLQLIGTMRKRFGAGDTYETSDIGTTRQLVEAAKGAGVDHLVLLSSLGAGRPVGAYLKAKAEAKPAKKEAKQAAKKPAAKKAEAKKPARAAAKPKTKK